MIDTGEWDEDSEIPENFEELPEKCHGILRRVSKVAYGQMTVLGMLISNCLVTMLMITLRYFEFQFYFSYCKNATQYVIK